MRNWKINDVYNIEWTDGGTFYMRPTYTCKKCGYTFDGQNECGTWSLLDKSPAEKNEASAVEHIIEHHIKK